MQKLLKGQVVHFTKDGIHHHARGIVAIGHDGRIAGVGDAANLAITYQDWPVEDHGEAVLCAGFVDAHIHFPQYRMLAAPAVDLLDWLTRYTFPEESRYGDEAYATAAADKFLNRLLAHGTTSAMAFCSVHKTCANALFAAAEKRNMALVTGKTMMDQNAIPAVQDTAEQGARESEALYHAWHGKGRLRYAVTPRFAVTSSEAQLAVSGELLNSLSGALMQTHISESAGEIAFVQHLFPWSRDYTDVYDRHGLLSERSVFAHGIHLTARERQRFAETGSSVVHCPTSNAFLGSGIMRMATMREAGIALGVATDVGGGTSYSMLTTLAETYKLQMLAGYKPSVHELFWLATQGNADRLHMGGETGSLDAGKWADVIVLNPHATSVLSSRQEVSQSIEDVLFSLMMLGDDRAITATYVAGKRLYPT